MVILLWNWLLVIARWYFYLWLTLLIFGAIFIALALAGCALICYIDERKARSILIEIVLQNYASAKREFLERCNLNFLIEITERILAERAEKLPRVLPEEEDWPEEVFVYFRNLARLEAIKERYA